MDLSEVVSGLHDAKLHSVELDWQAGSAQAGLWRWSQEASRRQHLTLRFEGLLHLACPRAQP